ncbi:MAG: hypothetical protein A3H97_17910 [Acidobacteria bacterium RIFCSPLOWO2_02_FULL_65_29]|nr:MAG: hypothetical protein A3H97_17910 [Acidobacteria bacterium RIFCSPLOWO2_02_FULL_65_29]
MERFTAAGYACVAESLPGHEPSDPAALASLELKHYLAALERVRAAMPAPPVIVGHSMGGLLGQQLATSGPCAALVCLATAPSGPVVPQLRSLVDIFPLLPPFLLGAPFRPTLSAFSRMGAQDVPACEQREIFDTVGYESVRAYRAMVFGTSAVAVGPVRCPMLCITAGDDRMIARRISNRTVARHGADHVVLEGRGHWLVARYGVERVAGAALDWLGRVLPRR